MLFNDLISRWVGKADAGDGFARLVKESRYLLEMLNTFDVGHHDFR